MAAERRPPPGFHSVTPRLVVADADAQVEEPLDTPYGDRRAMVRDPFGNVFQIANRITPHR
jgi:PhnB protein